jgi:hypothetical protein
MCAVVRVFMCVSTSVCACEPTPESMEAVRAKLALPTCGLLVAKIPNKHPDAESRVRIVREFQVLQSISHDNIIRYVDLCDATEIPCPVLIMEAAHINMWDFLSNLLRRAQSSDEPFTLLERNLVREVMRRIVEGLLAATPDVAAGSTVPAASPCVPAAATRHGSVASAVASGSSHPAAAASSTSSGSGSAKVRYLKSVLMHKA